MNSPTSNGLRATPTTGTTSVIFYVIAAAFWVAVITACVMRPDVFVPALAILLAFTIFVAYPLIKRWLHSLN
jgi:hypothetical protein